MRAEQRPDTPGGTELPPRFGATDVVETFDSASGSFRIHFTRAGTHAVAMADADASGVPDHVEEVAALYDEAVAFYRDELGLAAPPTDAPEAMNGGDGRFDVYLLDFPTGADGTFRREGCDAAGSCWGYMVQENDFAGRGYPSPAIGARIVGSHEFFHAVQAGVGFEAGSVPSEATAVWATEAFDPTLDDFENFLDGYLSRPERALGQDPTGPVDAFSYGAALFFRFLEERYDRAVVTELVASVGDAPWLERLDAILARAHGSSFAEAYAEHVVWNLYTASRADPSVAYAEGRSYPPLTPRIEVLPLMDESARVFPAAARVYQAGVAGGGEIVLELVSDDLADLSLALVAEGSSGLRAPVRAMASAGPLTLATVPGDSRVYAIVANVATSGSSKTPGLCLGAPAEVDACRAALRGEPPPSDAGELPDGGTPADAGAPTGGGSCAASATRPAREAWLALGLLAACARRRTKHRTMS